MRSFVGLGSNVGDRCQNVRAAVDALGDSAELYRVSDLYETAPVGYLDQPWFLNAVVELRWARGSVELLARLKEIERALGRKPRFRDGPREIDLDLLLFGNEISSSEELTVPHPRMHERRFVLDPLVEIAPDAFHPLLCKTARELLEVLRDAERDDPRVFLA